ncbi:hypothetical protein mRhiFer1_007826 [Rhinolophus ferrumequinum]|uniref:Uncharacterized protein n=1 Tax=Rhinolophus ferrumequinum TaxID=59479 RepID=A0A7J8AVL0_RHIFE|nr:hypothetical protein mRhiFer1_007826 [Rhinolophus ferrumequinum]
MEWPSQNLWVAIQNWEGYLGYGSAPQRSKGSQPHTRLHSPEYQEEMTQHQAVKNSGDSNSPVRKKAVGIADVLLKGLCTDSFAHKHSPRALSEGQTQEVSETYRERLSCVASERRLEGQSPFSRCRTLLPSSWQASAIPPNMANSESALTR